MDEILGWIRWIIRQLNPIEVEALSDFVSAYQGADSTSPVTVKVIVDVITLPCAIVGMHGTLGSSIIRYGIRAQAVTPDDRPIIYNAFSSADSHNEIPGLVKEAACIAVALKLELPKSSIVALDIEGRVVHEPESFVEAG